MKKNSRMVFPELCELLKSKSITVATAESCTGGILASELTRTPGASEYFPGGAVTYSNQSKQKILGVSAETLEKHGAVSEQTAREMAQGVKKLLNSDAAVSITGIAGPGGGRPDKPVGTVCFGAACKDQIKTFRELFQGNREEIRNQAAVRAAQILTEIIG